MQDLLTKALEIAIEAHDGQFRKDGKTPYIKHPMAVAAAFESTKLSKQDLEIVQAIAVLHDVIEDSDFTSQDLLDRGIPQAVVNDVIVLTHKSEDSYLEYILKFKGHPFATRVKVEDIKHNMSSLGPDSKTKLDKYTLAIYILENLT